MGHLIYQWLDLIWLPIAWFSVGRDHRWMTLGFILACMLTMRTQVELMESIGHPTGFLTLLDGHIFKRGLITYSVVIGIFLILAYFSQRTAKIVYFAALISIYILSFCVSMFFMVL